MATNDPDDKPKYWQIALLVWFLTLSTIVIGLSFWSLADIPAKESATPSLPAPTPPAPPPVVGPDAMSTQTELYKQQVTAYQALAAAYVTAVQAAKAEAVPESPRLKAYKEVVVSGLLKLVGDVFTAMFGIVVGGKALGVARQYLKLQTKRLKTRVETAAKPDAR